ncbi:sensor histidine kinase [Cellulomonas sp. JZ18]|uniref:sensor histidine kinase n=1 Tax=Cellulomonas sp. JZ18 TaxID=2654191 RepID=UPI001E440254|nr:sensor histidine kinase [Cellulomonas sp. JZ18]
MVTATVLVVCLLGGAMQSDRVVWPPSVAAYVVAVVSSVLLPARHRAPQAALVATAAVVVLARPLGLLPNPFVEAAVVVATYHYARTASDERRALGTVVLTAAALLGASAPAWDELSWQDASRMALVAAVPLVAGVLGYSVRTRRAYLSALEDRARRAEESRDREARRRVAEERLRIARELHDLVAHQITLANAQAEVAALFFDTRPEQARRSLDQLLGTTAQALDELRATVGLLRRSGDTAALSEPAPGLAGLPALVESVRGAGLEVSVREEGTARPLPAGVDLAAYRIVQEALTNATRHAGTDRAEVHLTWTHDRVVLTVSDDGVGTVTPQHHAPGYGLIGMRERAAAAGGTLTAGPRAEGGFRVRAELPARGAP